MTIRVDHLIEKLKMFADVSPQAEVIVETVDEDMPIRGIGLVWKGEVQGRVISLLADQLSQAEPIQ